VKIDLVIPELNLGGSERQLSGFAVALKEAGHDVTVITLRSGAVLEHDLLAQGVPIRNVGRRPVGPWRHGAISKVINLVVNMVRLARYWQGDRPYAVQAWLPEAQIVALPIAAALRIPKRVMALRSMTGAVRLTRQRRWLLHCAAKSSTYVVANAQAILDDPNWPISGPPKRVIRNAVRLPDRIANTGQHPPRGIVVANLTPTKGHRVLLQALALLSEPPTFTFVGSGSEKESLVKILKESGLEEVVSIVEGVTDPGDLLSAAQFFVLPSPSEGLPNAVLEAMAAGLPAIAFRVGGIPEIIDDGKNGVLVEPGDVPGLARAIERVAGDWQWRERAGTKAHRRARAFSWESVVRANLEVMGTPRADDRQVKDEYPKDH
jgi:glycosyltransferase involved in cell wall biosynthesis